MQEEITNFIQTNSPDGGFLQSEEWRKFQESAGRKTFNISGEGPASTRGGSSTRGGFWANIAEHELPIVGKYFYIPRGPVLSVSAERISNFQFPISNQIQNPNDSIKKNISEIIKLAEGESIGWVRFDANNAEILDLVNKNWRVIKAPHDMQPKELFIIDIAKPEEQLLAEMKSKTRYNIKLAQKHGVKISTVNIDCHPERSLAFGGINSAESKDLIGVDSSATCLAGRRALGMTNKYIEEFLRLVRMTAKRDGIAPHPDEYYRKMFETIPAENIKLYVAEYDGKVIAANVVVFYGRVATYLHGASDNEYRNVMAPYLLQWQAMLDAKAAGCKKYDLGGVKIQNSKFKIQNSGSWAGITRFKTGFSSISKPIKFPGSYDIIINPFRYNLYRILQRIKTLV